MRNAMRGMEVFAVAAILAILGYWANLHYFLGIPNSGTLIAVILIGVHLKRCIRQCFEALKAQRGVSAQDAPAEGVSGEAGEA